MEVAALSAVGRSALDPSAAPQSAAPAASGPSFVEALGKMFTDDVATVQRPPPFRA